MSEPSPSERAALICGGRHAVGCATQQASAIERDCTCGLMVVWDAITAAIHAAVEAERNACIEDAKGLAADHERIGLDKAEDAPCSSATHYECVHVARQFEVRIRARAAKAAGGGGA